MQPKPVIYKHVGSCFICTSHKPDSNGYPRFTRNGRLQYIHRYLYQLLYGSVDYKVDIHHRCENRMCINVGHLCAKTRMAHSHKHFNSQGKLTLSQISKIQADHNHVQQYWADLYGVNQSQISRVKKYPRRSKCKE